VWNGLLRKPSHLHPFITLQTFRYESLWLIKELASFIF
jgi:hypothetical protein